ncbi:alpha/beta hydrolase [Methanocella conradii]|uniref:alpha/beta hydrolase n=1 Tax=Methanocella conradii TaxID=1175444 RepID=UPI00157DCE4E|nr:alpha/beta fold hydrolase [Methanocella conradii]
MSKKREEKKRKKEHSRRLLYIGICAVAFIVVLGILFFAWCSQVPKKTEIARFWSIDDMGKLNFTERGKVEGRATVIENTDGYTLEKVVYKSFGDDVYALLRMPKNVTRPPVVVVLPAATVTKEGDHATAEALCEMGYASLTLDLRGNGGETGGYWVGNWTAGFDDFKAGGDPVQYKQVYDVLKGLDYVKSREDLDGGNVCLLGESMGGMWAIVAAGLEPDFKGVITISSCDFELPDTSDAQALRFVNAVLPSNYLKDLPPRKLAMFQFDGDIVVTMEQGKALYDKAYEPKAWHLYSGGIHGVYDKAYGADLRSELKEMLGK